MMKGKATEEQEKARHKFLACVFLAGVDGKQYGKTVDDLNNDFLLGAVSYPTDVPSMLSLLTNRRGDGGGNKYVNDLQDGVMGVSFVQEEGRMEGRSMRCFCCGKRGHSAAMCPERGTRQRNEWHRNLTAEQQEQ
jgi:hypothetical protein